MAEMTEMAEMAERAERGIYIYVGFENSYCLFIVKQ